MKLPKIILAIFFLQSFQFANTELPIGFLPEELDKKHIIREMQNRTTPPPSPIRNISEFEPMSGVLIRYRFGISTSII